MAQDVIRLVYASRAHEEITNADIKSILKSAQAFNHSVGIGGVLCFGGGTFVQILEGPENAVIRLYAKILDDPRHSDSRLLNVSIVQSRLFKNWSMGFLEESAEGELEIWKLAGYRQRSLSGAGVGVNIFKEIVDRLKAKKI